MALAAKQALEPETTAQSRTWPLSSSASAAAAPAAAQGAGATVEPPDAEEATAGGAGANSGGAAQPHQPSAAQRAAGLVARPFFFYLAPIQPHGPWLPAPRWQRRPSDLNDRKIPFAGYLDTMAEVDEMMGGVPHRVNAKP